MAATIEVLEMRRAEACDNVRAFAKVKVGGVTLHGVKVVQQLDQRPWVALPQTQSKDGK